MNPFCEPEMRTSMPHSSILHSIAPMEVTPSTTDTAPCSFIKATSSLSGFVTPVEVSLCVRVTIFISLLTSASSLAFKTFGSIACPAGTSIFSTLAPKEAAIFAQRLPKLPITSDNTLSPSLTKFDNAPSIAPVPLDV